MDANIKAGQVPKVAWYDSPWRIAGRAVAIAIATVLVLAAAALFVVPRAMGGTSLTILSGSMEPALMPGDVIAVRGIEERDVCEQVGVNDIITFFAEPGSADLITHRVVAKTLGSYPDGTSCRLVVQGDNNTAVDAPISPAQVRGVFLYGVPAIGWARDWFAQNPAIAIGGFAAIALAVYAYGAIRGPKTRVVNLPTTALPGVPATSAGQPPFGFDAAQPPMVAPPISQPTPAAHPATMLASMAPANPNWAVEQGAQRPAVGTPNQVPNSMDPNEFTLRMRELDLREREIAIREAETKARLEASGWLGTASLRDGGSAASSVQARASASVEPEPEVLEGEGHSDTTQSIPELQLLLVP